MTEKRNTKDILNDILKFLEEKGLVLKSDLRELGLHNYKINEMIDIIEFFQENRNIMIIREKNRTYIVLQDINENPR